MARFRATLAILVLISAFALGVGARAQDASPAASSGGAIGSEIAWLPEWTIKPDHVTEAYALLAEMEASAQSEPGTLSYALYLSEDGQTVTFFERYADEAAVLAHQATFGAKFADRANAAMTCTRITVLGAVTDAIRESVASCNPNFHKPLAGFLTR